MFGELVSKLVTNILINTFSRVANSTFAAPQDNQQIGIHGFRWIVMKLFSLIHSL